MEGQIWDWDRRFAVWGELWLTAPMISSVQTVFHFFERNNTNILLINESENKFGPGPVASFSPPNKYKIPSLWGMPIQTQHNPNNNELRKIT